MARETHRSLFHPLLFAVFMLVFFSQPCLAAVKQIGVYYFPGWADDQKGAVYKQPWEQIKPFPDREPLLGWYKEGDEGVMATQLEWMHKSGIKFVVFDWYWTHGQIDLGHAINAYQQVNQNAVNYSILWANHNDDQLTAINWDQIVGSWIKLYMQDPRYEKINGRPVVFIFSADQFAGNARHAGVDPATLIPRAQELAKSAGLKGIYFVAGSSGPTEMAIHGAKALQFDAISAYNFHPPRGQAGFPQLDATYRANWKALSASNLPMIVPVTSGWDKAPWGGSAFDNSISTPDQFEAHLRAANSYMNEQNDNYAVICCWNEFGEGSFIEPTRKNGFSYLDIIKRVFSNSLYNWKSWY